jgi:hypothetical protein
MDAAAADGAAPDAQEPDRAEKPSGYDRLTELALKRANELIADTTPPAPPTLSPDEQKKRLRNLAPATCLYGATANLHGPAYDVAGYAAFLEDFLKEAGSPTDPVERMLLEQLALAHHVVGRLHVQAGTNSNVPAVQMLHAAAARLMGEFRRTALALQVYRQRPAGKQVDAPARQKEESGDEPKVGTNGHAPPGRNGHAPSARTAKKSPRTAKWEATGSKSTSMSPSRPAPNLLCAPCRRDV